MKIKSGKDFWAGVMYLAFGLYFAIYARNYNMGTALRMGPGYFPIVLSWMLVLFGVAVIARSYFSKIESPFHLFIVRIPLLIASLAVGGLAWWQQAWLAGIHEWFALTINGVAILMLFASFGKRSLWQILMATVFFGYLLKPFGLWITTVLLIFGAAAAGHEFKFKEVLILAVLSATFCCLVFVTGLGLPFPIWPERG